MTCTRETKRNVDLCDVASVCKFTLNVQWCLSFRVRCSLTKSELDDFPGTMWEPIVERSSHATPGVRDHLYTVLSDL